jgi:glycosyltransferase involved in cell wall biosynthesis
MSSVMPAPAVQRKHGVRTAIASPLLSVVMPVYNERATIDEIIQRVTRVPMRIELIVIEDCSTDGTREHLVELQRQYNFTLLLQERNQGKGAALRRGFASVTGDIVVVQDADLEYSPEELPMLVELIAEGRADVVYGSRFLAGTACSCSRTTWATACSRSSPTSSTTRC